MDYKKYQNIRNAIWNIIIDLSINELPIKIIPILKKFDIPLHSYSENKNFINANNLNQLATKNDGFTIFKNDTHHIFYDDSKSIERIRFVLSHELGHIILNHLKETEISETNIEPTNHESKEEQQANSFAIRLLSPCCVLHEMELFTSKEIAEICQITEQSAKYRLARLKLLEKRNKKFLETKGYGCFYIDQLEKVVIEQFKEYMKNYKSLS